MQGKIGSLSFVNKELEKNNLQAKKKFGQNFLTDQNILTSIVDVACATKEDAVIEIGPGLGALTEHLCSACGFVLAYEIDKDLIPLLEKNLANFNNFKVINEDILKVDINKDIDELLSGYKNIYVVSNLPYYITTPIILGLLSQTNKIKRYVMMMKLEVADRICGKPSTKDHNALSLAVGYRALATKAFKVPRTVFVPQPNVDSAVIKLDVYDTPPVKAVDEDVFFKLIRECFTQRRKTLVNNLNLFYDKAFINKMLEELNINPSVRAEALILEDFVKMSDYISQNK